MVLIFNSYFYATAEYIIVRLLQKYIVFIKIKKKKKQFFIALFDFNELDNK